MHNIGSPFVLKSTNIIWDILDSGDDIEMRAFY